MTVFPNVYLRCHFSIPFYIFRMRPMESCFTSAIVQALDCVASLEIRHLPRAYAMSCNRPHDLSVASNGNGPELLCLSKTVNSGEKPSTSLPMPPTLRLWAMQ